MWSAPIRNRVNVSFSLLVVVLVLEGWSWVTSLLNRPVFADILTTKIVAYREYHPTPRERGRRRLRERLRNPNTPHLCTGSMNLKPGKSTKTACALARGENRILGCEPH